MPLDTFIFELAYFLTLVRILASLPTEPYFHPWHEPSYRINHSPHAPTVLRRNDPRIEGQVFPVFQRNFTRRRGESEFPSGPYGLPPQERWYQFEERERSFQDDRQGLPAFYRSEMEDGRQLFYRRSSESAPGNEYLSSDHSGNANAGKAYSSHVNCQAPNQNKGMKMPKEIRDNIEPIFGSHASGKVDERINFQEASRNSRNDESKSQVPNPRIVTPKGARRPAQGNSAKTQNRPLPSASTNTISTTEKPYRNQTTKGSKRPRPSATKAQGGGDIVFPDGYPKKFVPLVSKCAKKSTFCEHLGEEYPGEYISQILKKEGAMFREFFGKDVISDPNITERINAPEENSLCPYRQEVVFPRAAQNKEDKWLFIINQDQYVQGVTVEVCLNPESRCILTEGFPLGYTPYCKQKYIERRLVAIGEDGKPHSDSFRLPSCCSCVVKHESSARMRLRSSRAAAPAPPRP